MAILRHDHHDDRPLHAGGILAYIKSDLAYNRRYDIHDDHIEALWFDILLPMTKPITFGICYRPPDDHNFLGYLESCFSKITPGNEIIIMGDLNIDFKKKGDYLFKRYKHMLEILGLNQIIKFAYSCYQYFIHSYRPHYM